MRVLSLGAGVQSSTLLLMACTGEIAVDAAVFADTQWEGAAVYRHLDWLEQQAKAAGIPVYRVTAGNLRADALAGEPKAWMPLYAFDQHGTKRMLKRQCTTNYKLTPIHRQLRALLKPARVRYIRHEWPLIDRRMTRADCLRWMDERGYPRPPKSSCVACPYRDNAAWRAMRDHAPDDWADAVAFDAAIRTTQRAQGTAFVHRSFTPLPLVDLRTEQDKGQLELFTNECSGTCGV